MTIKITNGRHYQHFWVIYLPLDGIQYAFSKTIYQHKQNAF